MGQIPHRTPGRSKNHVGPIGTALRKQRKRPLYLEALENLVLLSGVPQLLDNVNAGTLASSPDQITEVGEIVFFSARDSEHGHELWSTDGTAEGTVLVE